MKSAPTPDVPGNLPWERLENAVRAVFAVPKEAIEKEKAKLKRKATKKRVEKAARSKL